MTVMWFIAKEPPDRVHQPLRAHLACLFERDGWTFSAIYIVTAGGFIGVASFLPTYFYDQFRVTKVEAGQLTMLATLMSAVARVVGGRVADRVGGINVLSGVLLLVSITLLLCGLAGGSIQITTWLLTFYFILLGAGSGALFQLVPLRWPTTTAVVVSMIGEVGAFGGGLIPNAMGQSKQHTGTYLWGFIAFAIVPAAMLLLLCLVQRRWTRTWVGRGGRALEWQQFGGSAREQFDQLRRIT
jgi:NNP family nitrate/nitrite transporter-like MFS transporter